MKRQLVPVLACLGLAVACDEAPFDDTKQRAAVAHIVDDVALPTIRAPQTPTQLLSLHVAGWDGAVLEEELNLAQTSWRTAHVAWRETEAFGFGPANDERIAVNVDQSPIDRTLIEADLVAFAEFDETYLAQLGANRRGMHAIEYLLFDEVGGAAVILPAPPKSDGAQRCELLSALAGDVESKLARLNEAWSPAGDAGDGGYGEHLKTLPKAKSAIDGFVNQAVFLAENVAHKRIAEPFGLSTGNAPDPMLAESPWSQSSVADMRASIASIRNVYLGSIDGSDGIGLNTLVIERHPTVDTSVRDALEAADSAMAALQEPLADPSVDQAVAAQAAFDAVIALKRVLSAELVSALGVTLSFNDNDGD